MMKTGKKGLTDFPGLLGRPDLGSLNAAKL